MGETLATTLPLAALEMALQHRQPPAGVVPSMSRRGNCYDNALMESFWSSLKRELVQRSQFATRKAARTAIFDGIEIFYNRERLHSALGFKSPVDFETNLN
jgi:transposase InsO family protein